MLSTGVPLFEKVDADKIDHHRPHLVFKGPERVFLPSPGRLLIVVVCQGVDAEGFVGDSQVGIEFCRNGFFSDENPVVLRVEEKKGENGLFCEKASVCFPGGSVVREKWTLDGEVKGAEEVTNMLGGLGVKAEVERCLGGEVTLKE
jgi:hypothetical protein